MINNIVNNSNINFTGRAKTRRERRQKEGETLIANRKAKEYAVEVRRQEYIGTSLGQELNWNNATSFTEIKATLRKHPKARKIICAAANFVPTAPYKSIKDRLKYRFKANLEAARTYYRQNPNEAKIIPNATKVQHSPRALNEPRPNRSIASLSAENISHAISTGDPIQAIKQIKLLSRLLGH